MNYYLGWEVICLVMTINFVSLDCFGHMLRLDFLLCVHHIQVLILTMVGKKKWSFSYLVCYKMFFQILAMDDSD